MVRRIRANQRHEIILLTLGVLAGAVLIGMLMANFDQIRRWQEKYFGPVPSIEAVVEAVKGDDELVVLSVGQDQKIQEGFEFMIFRGEKIIGKVRVHKVFENLAGARILSTAPNETILPQDEATRWR
jgi:hypothetical protein